MKTIVLLFALTLCGKGEIVRLSLVSTKAKPGYSLLEFGDGEQKSAIFVNDVGFITEKDIASAMPSPSRADGLDITLSEEGTNKMIAATERMRGGLDRIAIIVDGKILSAPVVQSVPLGKNFVINGLNGEDEPATLAARLMGKSLEETKLEIAKEKERIASLPQPPPPVYHTDEEYALLVGEREKIGLHYMDRLYTEEDLKKLLSPGMILADVTGIFGKANRVSRKDNGDWEMTFQTAPEKYPMEEKYHLNSFIATFSDGKLVSWRPFGSSKTIRAPKPWVGKPKKTNLIIKTPPADMSSEDFSFIVFLEGHEISLKSGEQEPTDSDIHRLMGALWSLSATDDETQSIDSQCDWFSLVAKKIPELAVLAKKSANGKVPLSSLKTPLEPYVYGEKPLP